MTGDIDARNAINDALDDTLIVEAAAGTGKTTELVRRILRVLETDRATMVEIVAVTFTEKAAGELKLRLRESLEQRRAAAEAAGQADVKARLDVALETLEEAHVNTIHGFCADLLRERPVEATVDPLFAVLTEPQAARLYSRAFRDWLQEALKDPPEGVRRALKRTSGGSFFGGGTSDGPIDRLEKAGRQLAEGRDFPAPWARRPFDRISEIERLVSALHAFADLTAAPASQRDNLFADTAGARRLSGQIRLEQSFGQVEHDAWEARLVDLVRDRGFSRPRKGSGYKFSAAATRTDVLMARDRLFADLQQFRKEADADLAACLQGELAAATARYQALKSAAGALDFADLLSRARDLLRTNASVRRHLQGRFKRIFIDEFQDTDPVQAEILLLLAADDPEVDRGDRVRPTPGKLFLVGDPKQAIYRFRGTDVATYWRVGRYLEAHGGRVVKLTTSYRSVPGIQRFVNAAFAPAMVANDLTLQADYVPLSPSRQAIASQPSVIALPVPRPYSGRGSLRASGKAIDESLPDAVGAFIAWLVDPRHGWTVDGQPLQPRHVAVLFRRFSSYGEDVTRRYTDAMEARGVPHLLVGGKSFHGREEVETLRAALAAIEWPDDELSVFATLKGSLFAIDDAHLLEFRHRFHVLHPFRVPKELGGNSGQELVLTAEPTSHLQPIADILRLLQQLHRQRNYRPVADTIARLLDETRAHVGFILRQSGEQALANVLHVAEMARQYEAGGGISFRGFIEELRLAAESEAAEAPILEESSDGVRLMTVHKAKGLEFPVVILADLTCRMSRGEASRYLDADRQLLAMKIGGWAPHELHEHEGEEVARDEAEGVRLAYVAATRARDLLVVPALGDGAWDGGWFAPLNDALYPPTAHRRNASRAPGCPTFKSKDSVLERPNDEMAGPFTVCPGVHAMQADNPETAYDIVWWDPSILALGAKPSFGVRRDDLIVKDVPRNVVADGRSRYDRWRLARADALDRGKIPSLDVRTVREYDEGLVGREGQEGRAGQVGIEYVSRRPGPSDPAEPSGGAAYGVLVHAVLALAAFDADGAQLQDLATSEARMLGLSEEDAAQAAAAAGRALKHDLLQRAGSANDRGACRRETPVTLLTPDGVLVEGVVDLAFEENGAWTVVDYKTDRELEGDGLERYRRQVALYAQAIAGATGQPTSGVILGL